MSDEQDSWFQSAFGLNIGGVADRIRSEAEEAAGKVQSAVQSVRTAVEEVVDDVVDTVTDVAKKVAGAAGVGGGGGSGGGGAGGGSPKPAGPAGGGTGSFPLSGSVGRGGRNAPGDVKAVQKALGIGVDGDCGSKTIAAIEAFQRNMGQSKPDGRVDAGGPTERALATGGKFKPEKTNVSEDDSGSFFDKALDGVQGLAGGLAGGIAGGLGGGLVGGGLAGGLAAGGLVGGVAGAVAGGLRDLGGKVVDEVKDALDDPRVARMGVLPDLPPRPPPDEVDDPNVVFAGERFRMKMLGGMSFGEFGGLTSLTFVIWDVDNSRAALYDYEAVILTAGSPFTSTSEGDWSDVFTTKAMQVDQFSCNASHAAAGAANIGFMVLNLDVATVSVPTGFSEGGGIETGGGFFSLINNSVKVFKGP